MPEVTDQCRRVFPVTGTELKVYSLVDSPDMDAEISHVERVLTRYHRFLESSQGMATVYSIEPGRLGTTIRIYEETDKPDNCKWYLYNAEDGILMGHGKSAECNKETRIFGREAGLMEELGFDVPRWMETFAVKIGE
jgi:hypothetical protein